MTFERLLWGLAAAVLCVGYFLGVAPAERTVAVLTQATNALDDRATRNERHIAAIDRLRAVAGRVSADVRELAGQRNEAATTAACLQILSREAGTFHLRITHVSPLPPASTGARRDDGLIGESLEVGASGRFRDVVAFLSTISRREMLLEVGDVSLSTSAAAANPGVPELAATLHATLYRLKHNPLSENNHATPN